MLWEHKKSRSIWTGILCSPNLPVGRTFTASFNIPEITRKVVLSPKPVRLYRNPVYLAEEWQKRMQIKGFTQAELARDLGVTRARVSQVLNMLKLPEDVLAIVRDHGDPMEKRLVTERKLRRGC